MQDIILTALAPLSWGATYFVTTQLLPPNRPLFVGLMRVTGRFADANLKQKASVRSLVVASAVLGALNIGKFRGIRN